MIWHGFTRTLLFGAAAGLGWPAASLLMGGFASPSQALAVYLVGVAAIYVAGLGHDPRRALGNGALGLGLGLLVLLLAPNLTATALGAAAIVALGRTRVVRAKRRARGMVVEVGCLALGLGLARALATPAMLDVSLSIWAFFVAQSLVFLAPGLRTHRPGRDDVDPFDLAVARVEAMMEEPASGASR